MNWIDKAVLIIKKIFNKDPKPLVIITMLVNITGLSHQQANVYLNELSKIFEKTFGDLNSYYFRYLIFPTKDTTKIDFFTTAQQHENVNLLIDKLQKIIGDVENNLTHDNFNELIGDIF